MYNAALDTNDFDEAGFYTGMFPAGCPYIYYHEEHPLIDRFRKLYGDTMFLMYHPADDKEEFFVLLEGEVEYCVYDTKKPRLLKPGDTVYMKANVPHAVSLAAGCSHAKALLIYSDPSSD